MSTEEFPSERALIGRLGDEQARKARREKFVAFVIEVMTSPVGCWLYVALCLYMAVELGAWLATRK